MRHSIPIVLLLLAVGAATFVLFGRESDAPPSPAAPEALDAELEAPEIADASARFGDDGVSREGVDVPAASRDDQAAVGEAVRVIGRVVDAGGAGVAKAEVFVRARPDFGGFGNFRGRRGGTDIRALMAGERDPGRQLGTTDAGGYYDLTAAMREDERLEVAARRAGLAPAATRVDFESYDEASGEVRVADLVLDVGTTVRGYVVSNDGTPVPGANVTATTGWGGGRRGGGRFDGRYAALLLEPVTTDDAGGFELHGVSTGTWSLTADAPGYLTGRSESIEADASVPVENVKIEVALGAPLTGTVVDVAGEPIGGALVTVTRARERTEADADRRNRGGFERMFGRARVEAETGPDGTYVFDAVPRGPVRVEVEHPRHLTAERQPADALATPRIDFTLADRLAIAGVVVDAESGTAVDTFAIEARRLDRGGWGGAGRDRGAWGRGARGRGDDDAERIEYLRARIGGAGLVPGETPDPSAHANGRFEVLDLLPGRYALDVRAPGYVTVVAEVVELEADAGETELTVRVQRGTTVRGVVVDGEGQPVARARVELLVPPPPATPSEPAADRRGGDRRAMRELFDRGEGGRTEVRSATTGRDGRFEFEPVLPGSYVLRGERRGFTEREIAELWVPADRAVFETEVELIEGATVRGRLIGHERGSRPSVVFVPSESGSRRSTRVDAETGEYEIRGLEAGAYFVEVQEGRERGWGRGGPDIEARLQALAGRTPHVIVAAGQTLRHDVLATAIDVGRVTGQVLENGQPARGFEVRLERLDPVQSGVADPEQVRVLERILGRMSRGRVDGEGRFEIEDVLPGAYRLEVVAGGGRRGGGFGRGGGGGAAIHAENVVVAAGSTAEVRIGFSSAKLSVVLTSADGAGLPRGVQVVIAAAYEAGDRPPAEWRDLESFARLTARNGTATAEAIAAGSYRYAVTGIGIRPTLGAVTVGPGDDRSVTVAVAEQSAAEFLAEYDANADGKLSGDEIPQQIRRFMGRIDTDGDGAATAEELDAIRATLRERGNTDRGPQRGR